MYTALLPYMPRLRMPPTVLLRRKGVLRSLIDLLFHMIRCMDWYMNENLPGDIPVKLPGPSYSVIARLVLLDGSEELRPARAVCWTPTHVMIKLQERDGLDPQYLWLHSRDVHRAIRRA